MNRILCLVCACAAYSLQVGEGRAAGGPNVILIVCDDLNDYVEGFGGHPNARTPSIAKLADSGVSFTQAHCTVPICGPSRASFLTGIYPHHSGCYGFERWDRYEVLRNSRTIMSHFRANGYLALGTGKLMHHIARKDWEVFGNPADYGPFVSDGTENYAHPDVPDPYRKIGPVDGSFGPLINLAGRKAANGKPLIWRTGGWNRVRTLRVDSQENRDRTADELNGNWAVEKLRGFADRPPGKPFFMGVGFIRPHTPLIVPKRFFDMFPLESIALPVIRPGDVADTHARSIRGIVSGKEPHSTRTQDMGARLYRELVASYPSRDEALKRFIQAYLASVAAVDEQIGRIMAVVDGTSLKKNTVVVLTSDHGWGMGEKDYLYKNSLWQESTQVPLIIRAPGIAKRGAVSNQPVSLIDLYPTLIDICQLTGDTRKNEKGRALDGHSLRPLLEAPGSGAWTGPDEALTTLYKWAKHYDPSEQSYALRSKDWRYIRYENGKEELYHASADPHEWHNLADKPEHATRLRDFRKRLQARLPAPGTVPPQPVWKPKAKPAPKLSAEIWKQKYFANNPQADANGDGKLSWPELKAHKAKADAKK